MAKKKSDTSIREFRSAIARLKRAGLIHPGIDARGVVPTRPLNNAIRKFQDVLRNNAAVIPLKKLNLTEREAVKRNFQLSKPIGLPTKLIVRHFPEETVKADKGSLLYSSPEGIRRLELPKVRTDTARHFFQDLKQSKVKLPDRIKGQVFGARFFSGRTQTFDSLRDLLNTLNVYDSVVSAHGRKHTADIIRNIEILTIPTGEKQLWNVQKKKGREVMHKRQAARRKAARKK